MPSTVTHITADRARELGFVPVTARVVHRECHSFIEVTEDKGKEVIAQGDLIVKLDNGELHPYRVFATFKASPKCVCEVQLNKGPRKQPAISRFLGHFRTVKSSQVVHPAALEPDNKSYLDDLRKFSHSVFDYYASEYAA